MAGSARRPEVAAVRELTEPQATAIVRRFQDRLTDPAWRPEDSLPVEVLLFAYPVRPPAG